jgi:hypothetical protein
VFQDSPLLPAPSRPYQRRYAPDMRDIVPDSDGFCQPVPGHPSEHGAHAESTWSRPLQENHHDSHMTDSRLFGDHPAGAARAVDTVRNFRRIEPAADCGPPIDHSSTRDSPLCPLSVMPEAISDSERGCDVRNAGWLKTSRVNHGDGVLAPTRWRSSRGRPWASSAKVQASGAAQCGICSGSGVSC